MFLILLLSLLSKNSKSFTFQQCQSQYDCLQDIYDEANFTSTFVNNLYEQNTNYKSIYVKEINDSELTLNLDGFNHNLKICISNEQELQLTIKTNASEISAQSCLPNIYAREADVIINNINDQNEKTLFVVNEFEFKTLSITDQTKPLYLVYYFNDYHYSNSYSISGIIKLDKIYVAARHFSFPVNQPLENSLTIIISPFLNYTQRYYDEDPCFLRESECTVYTPSNTIITYGKQKINYEFSNQKTLTIISETRNCNVGNCVSEGSIIDIESGLSSNDIFSPYIFSYGSGIATIKGNWPIFKTDELPGEFMENGSFIHSFDLHFLLTGSFLFAANHFPIKYLNNNVKIFLTEKSSSIYFLRDSIYANLTIETMPQNNDDEFVFYMEGKCIEIDNSTYTNHMGEYEVYNAIHTSSDKLTIIVNALSEIQHNGTAKIIYRKIDNSEQKIKNTLPFLQGGTINIPFSVDYFEIAESLSEIYESYASEHPRPQENAPAEEWTNYFIDFAKNKISDLSSKINIMENKVIPITVDLKQNSYSESQKNRVVLLRNDIPVSALYQNGLNKVSNVICLSSGTVDINNWDIRIGTNILRSFLGDDDEWADEFFDQYYPTFAETKIEGEITSNENGKCIAYKPSSVPGSSFEFIIYTSNTTFSEILEKVSLITTLTPSDLDAFSKLKSSKSKNLVVAVLDDIPDGKSINLKGIREDANVFLMGYKTNEIKEILTMIDDLNAINWSDKSNEEENNRIESEIMSIFASKYKNYQPKASVAFDTVQSFLVGLINYCGTHIKCKNFYPILSEFTNVDALANDFSAEITLTESITYKLIENLQFKDLVIFPVSVDPPNIFVVDQINFTESKWTLKLTAFSQNPVLEINESNYEINTGKISGQLIIYSFTSNCIFNVPETKEKQQIKGITINSHFTNFNIKEIPGIMILEDTTSSKKIQDILMRLPIKFMHELFDIVLKPSTIITKMTKLSFKNRKVIREEEEEEQIVFEGNWNKVETITGSIEVNTGDHPAVINNIPEVVANVLEVKSTQNVQLDSPKKEMRFSQPQVITQPKTISFSNEEMKVTFSNLTFKGTSTGLSLMLNGKASKVITDHVVLTSNTNSLVSAEIEVKESFEFGPSSSLVAQKITSTNPKLTMNYRLSEGFGTIPDSIEPKSIVLNYIGESNGDSIPDYESFIGSIKDVKTFTGDKHKDKCNEWKGKTTLESFRFPEFKGEKSVIEVLCIDKTSSSTLLVNVSAIPSGVVQEPSSEGNGGNGGAVDKDKDPKKFPIGGIIGIAVGGVAVIAIVSILTFYFVSKKRKVNAASNEEASP